MSLPNANEDLLVAHTAVLAQLALIAPDSFEVRSDVITSFLLKKILMAGNEASPVNSQIHSTTHRSLTARFCPG